jgi:hypothetical protein
MIDLAGSYGIERDPITSVRACWGDQITLFDHGGCRTRRQPSRLVIERRRLGSALPLAPRMSLAPAMERG